MLAPGVVSHNQSPFSSLVVIVKKDERNDFTLTIVP